MNRPKLITKAEAIDNRKDKLLLAGAALLIGLFAAALFSPKAMAQSPDLNTNKTEGEWTAQTKPHDEMKLPFELKSQKLSH